MQHIAKIYETAIALSSFVTYTAFIVKGERVANSTVVQLTSVGQTKLELGRNV